IIDPNGALVALGTENRFFSRAQRLGMIARDGPTCSVPGCQIPATGCEAHHIEEHCDGGPTHTHNGALFCWFHHRMIDTGVFTVTMVNGKPHVTIPDWLQRKPYFR
ncbi:MAG: HNH endonuclease signature motif containing protein, partial [Mycetocola sp.]